MERDVFGRGDDFACLDLVVAADLEFLGEALDHVAQFAIMQGLRPIILFEKIHHRDAQGIVPGLRQVIDDRAGPSLQYFQGIGAFTGIQFGG